MRRESFEQIEVICGSTPEEFQSKFNATVRKYADRFVKSEIQIDKLLAVITYKESITIKESVADEFHAEGIHFFCRDCPLKETPKDGRVKHVGCKYSEYGHTHIDHEACELFYKKMKQGTVTPITD